MGNPRENHGPAQAPHHRRLVIDDPCKRASPLNIRPIQSSGPDDNALSEAAVAGYIAKYATKAAETSGTLDRRVTHHDLTRTWPQSAYANGPTCSASEAIRRQRPCLTERRRPERSCS